VSPPTVAMRLIMLSRSGSKGPSPFRGGDVNEFQGLGYAPPRPASESKLARLSNRPLLL
jgi:hypothetical protein